MQIISNEMKLLNDVGSRRSDMGQKCRRMRAERIGVQQSNAGKH